MSVLCVCVCVWGGGESGFKSSQTEPVKEKAGSPGRLKKIKKIIIIKSFFSIVVGPMRKITSGHKAKAITASIAWGREAYEEVRK